MRVYVEAMGCRLNAAEAEVLTRRFAGAGHEVVDDPAWADVIVMNSCAVTGQAVRKGRRRVRTLHRLNPHAEIAVTGCWATASPDAIGKIDSVHWVVANDAKHEVVERVTDEGRAQDPAPWAPGRWGHTRAFVGVQDGCDHACTYCVTRLLRGPAQSRPLEEALAEVRHAVMRGAQEVVLTGVSLGAYGRDLGLDDGLALLGQRILAETTVPRLRFSSIEPWDVTEALIDLWRDGRVCRQLHLPLQSGSDAVLRRMGRRITVDGYRALVAAVREVAPELALTTDLIAGFPGESEEDFRDTVSLVEAFGFARLHVFPYSERAGTAAARLAGQVPAATRRDRARTLRRVGHRLSAAYRERFVGQVVPVLWERRDGEGVWVGWSDIYVEVRTRSGRELYNRVTQTQLTGVGGGFLVGEVMV